MWAHTQVHAAPTCIQVWPQHVHVCPPHLHDTPTKRQRAFVGGHVIADGRPKCLGMEAHARQIARPLRIHAPCCGCPRPSRRTHEMPRVARRGRVWTAKARQHWAATHTDGHPRSSSRGGPQTRVESHAFGLWTGVDAHSGIVLGDHGILLDGHVIRVGVHSKPSWRPTHIEWAPIARWIGRPHTLRGLPR